MKDKHIILILSMYGLSMVWFTFFKPHNNIPTPQSTSYLSILPDTIYLDTTFIKEYTDESLIGAIMYVESRGNDSAYNKQSGATGCMQIMPVMVREVNRINQIINSDQEYTLDDRWDCEKSIEMFLIWKSFHHKHSDYETISRHWWGGPKYGEQECSIFYWEKVKENLES